MSLLSFGIREAHGLTIIDWGMRGGQGCRPATIVELEMLDRIRALEALLREIDGKVVFETAVMDESGPDLQERVEKALGIGAGQ